MAGSKSNYLENKLLLHVLGNTPFASPGTDLYLALFTADSLDGSVVTEVTGGSYARQQAAFAITNNVATVNGPVAFPAATANWGTVVGAAIYDDPTAGNQLYWFDLTTSKTIQTDDAAIFADDAITVTED